MLTVVPRSLNPKIKNISRRVSLNLKSFTEADAVDFLKEQFFFMHFKLLMVNSS